MSPHFPCKLMFLAKDQGKMRIVATLSFPVDIKISMFMCYINWQKVYDLNISSYLIYSDFVIQVKPLVTIEHFRKMFEKKHQDRSMRQFYARAELRLVTLVTQGVIGNSPPRLISTWKPLKKKENVS